MSQNSKPRSKWVDGSASRKRQKQKHDAEESSPQVDRNPANVENFEDKIGKKLGFKPRDFQDRAIKAQLLRKDTLVHAATGSGKTLIAAAPHYHASAKGMITLFVSPLIALQNEQVLTFEKEFKLRAVAVNSSHGGCSPEVLESLKDKENGPQIVIISPELLLSRRFINIMLRDKTFTSHVLSVVVDEAHVMSHWGAGFHKKYGELGMLRAFLPRGTSMVAMSATLSPGVRSDVLKKLEFDEANYEACDAGNDRPNVSLVVRAIEHTQESLTDLNFVIPKDVTKVEDIPLMMIYADSVPLGPDIVQHLDRLLPAHLQGLGVIRPFSAAGTQEYRTDAMTEFKSGTSVRVLVCMDAAGMGCNIPAVDIVVQWKLPSSLSLFVQRAGRAARDPSRKGVGNLLVERSAYSLVLEEQVTNKGATKGKGDNKKGKGGNKRTKKVIQEHAAANGVHRGSHSGAKDEIVGEPREVKPDTFATDEGLLTFVHTTGCRRLVLTRVYHNKITPKPPHCCDLCDPTLLDKCHPGPRPPKPTQQKKNLRDVIVPEVQSAIWDWRESVYDRDYSGAIFGPSALLSDTVVDDLALAGKIKTLERLKLIIGAWKLWDTYSDELLAVLKRVPADCYNATLPGADEAPQEPGADPEGIDGINPAQRSRKRKEREDDDGGEEQERLIAASAPISTVPAPSMSTASTSLTHPPVTPHNDAHSTYQQAQHIQRQPMVMQPHSAPPLYAHPETGEPMVYDYAVGAYYRYNLAPSASGHTMPHRNQTLTAYLTPISQPRQTLQPFCYNHTYHYSQGSSSPCPPRTQVHTQGSPTVAQQSYRY